MIRSVCVVSREYPPDTGYGGIARVAEMTAQALVERGIAVHVISLSPSGVRTRMLHSGVAVHRLGALVQPFKDCPDIDQALWAATVADFYRELDAQIDFDAVLAPDYGGEAAKIELGPATMLVTQLHSARAIVQPWRLDPRCEPSFVAASEAERLALGRSDRIVAPTQLVADRTLLWLGPHAPPLDVLPVPFDTSGFPTRRHGGEHALELVFVGRLEPNKGPELAIEALAELRRRGVDGRLTLVGRDTATGPSGSSYRQAMLVPQVTRLEMADQHVRFVDELDFAGVLAQLAVSDAAILPSRWENLHAAALEALGVGLPVVCGAQSGLAGWVGVDDGLATIDVDNSLAFAAAAADRLCDHRWLQHAGDRGAALIRRIFNPATAVERLLDTLEAQGAERRPFGTTTRVARHAPTLGVIVLAHNALAYTQRCVRSLLHHTTVPMRLVVVDNASVDGTADWLRSLDDPRVHPVVSSENLGVPGGRNAGLDHLDGDEDWIVFLDNDTEVLADWWRPYVQALEAEPEAGIAGEEGVMTRWGPDGRQLLAVAGAGVQPCDVVVGFCMVMRPASVERIGRFDPGLGLFWHDDDDYALRAARVGERVLRVGCGRVLHYEHRSSATVPGIWVSPGEPAAMSEDNQRYLARRVSGQAVGSEAPFLVTALAHEVLGDPNLLATFARAFTADDPAALVIWGPGYDPGTFELDLREAAAGVAFDLEAGPKVLALLPPEGRPADERQLADQVFAVLGTRPMLGALAHLAVVPPGDPDRLRLLAARAWRAQRRGAPRVPRRGPQVLAGSG